MVVVDVVLRVVIGVTEVVVGIIVVVGGCDSGAADHFCPC